MGFEQRYTDGDYLAQNPGWSLEDAEWKAGMIAALLLKNNVQFNTVTEIGCGAGGVLHGLQQRFGSALFSGYDISPQAIAMAQKLQQDKLQFYQEDFLQKDTAPADLLLVIDVVEHVADFYNFLKQVKAKGRQFVFHIPLDMSCRTLLKPHVLLQQRQSVGHIHYFTKELVCWAMQDCGYTISHWQYTKPRIDIDSPGGFKRAVKKLLRNLCYSINKNLSVKIWGGYSILILAE
jgi:cyclopropane fatty-acyl-phospholipid synthase-like methyltransferase